MTDLEFKDISGNPTRPRAHPSGGTGEVTLLDRLLCRLGKCRRCVLLSTDDGIGGQCEACGRVHGWMSRVELALAIGRDANLPPAPREPLHEEGPFR